LTQVETQNTIVEFSGKHFKLEQGFLGSPKLGNECNNFLYL
jgi:hypothetical protein